MESVMWTVESASMLLIRNRVSFCSGHGPHVRPSFRTLASTLRITGTPEPSDRSPE